MGSKNCPETPRQKMIGMMYLFLTAMLAINLSPEILKSFLKVDESLRMSAENFGKQNKIIYDQFDIQYSKNAKKVDEWRQKAQEIKQSSQVMYDYIQKMKVAMAKKADKDKYTSPDSLHTLDNVEVPNNYLLDPLAKQKGEKTHGESLRDSITMYKEILLSRVEDRGLKEIIASTLATDPPSGEDDGHGSNKISDGKKQWEDEMFAEKPLVATMAMLTKLQNDIRNTEAISINHLFEQIDANDIKVNKVSAFMNAKSTYIMKGGQFEASIGIAAMDTTKRPEVYINGQKVTLKHGKYIIPANSTGKFDLKGRIEYMNADGEMVPLALDDVTYEVFEPFAAVSADKMNVLYAGVDNPVSVAVPGVSASDIIVSVDNGKLTPSGDGYIIKPSKLGLANVTIKAEIDGKMTVIGTPSKFRVKQLPNPTAYIGYPKETKDAQGKTVTLTEQFYGGQIRKRELITATEVGAALQGVDFEASFTIKGFDIRTYDSLGNAKTIKSDGAKFSSQQEREIRSIRPGKSFFLVNIHAMGPDGLDRTLSPVEVIVTQ